MHDCGQTLSLESSTQKPCRTDDPKSVAFYSAVSRSTGNKSGLFAELTETFRRLSPEDLSLGLKEDLSFKAFLPIFLDESQACVNVFSGKFHSPWNGKNYCLFYTLGKALRSLGCFICSGTSLCIKKGDDIVVCIILQEV
jgi:hypothetical protein